MTNFPAITKGWIQCFIAKYPALKVALIVILQTILVMVLSVSVVVLSGLVVVLLGLVVVSFGLVMYQTSSL